MFVSANIVVVGLDWPSLVIASVLTINGHQVLGVDNDTTVVDTIKRGGAGCSDRDILVPKARNRGNLQVSLAPEVVDILFYINPGQ